MEQTEATATLGGPRPASALPPPGVEIRASAATPANDHGRGGARPLVESIPILFIGMLLVRTFAAEAYIVPTGSMAPTLLGVHRDVSCTSCGLQFPLGVDEQGQAGRPLCPNCGADLERAPAADRSGDRLLVQKNFFRWRPPRRWEVVVFLNPSEPDQAYVKRVVGLPGESIEIIDGDIYIDGRLARKTDREQQGMRLLVFDSRFQPPGVEWSRHRFSRGDGLPTGWSAEGRRFLHVGGEDEAETDSPTADWIEYRHIDPDRGDYGPIRDFIAYNGARIGSGRKVDDLAIDAELTLSVEVEAIVLRFGPGIGPTTLEVTIPLDGLKTPRADYLGQDYRTEPGAALVAASWARREGPRRLEASFIDHRLSVSLDGDPLFEPLDLQPPSATPPPTPIDEPPIAIGLVGGVASVDRMRIYRDVFYTDGLSHAPGRPFGVGEPYRLGPDEYFVLGDNSPVSNDSRFWSDSPVVPGSMLLGKPFLVHLPSRGIPLRVFGGEPYWVPDLREIRYIR